LCAEFARNTLKINNKIANGAGSTRGFAEPARLIEAHLVITAALMEYVVQLERELAETERRLEGALLRQRELVTEQELARQRVEREARREIARSKGQIIAEILPVLDDLDRAIAAADAGGEPGALRRGVELVRASFLDRLRALGVERDDPTGHQFDPLRHDAVSVAPGAVSGSVLATVSPGYRLEGEVLRPARVVVARSDRRGETDYPAAR
jgi:molecular chaperone GrpE